MRLYRAAASVRTPPAPRSERSHAPGRELTPINSFGHSAGRPFLRSERRLRALPISAATSSADHAVGMQHAIAHGCMFGFVSQTLPFTTKGADNSAGAPAATCCFRFGRAPCGFCGTQPIFGQKSAAFASDSVRVRDRPGNPGRHTGSCSSERRNIGGSDQDLPRDWRTEPRAAPANGLRRLVDQLLTATLFGQ